MVGDVLLTCSGGNALPLGSLIPTANVTVYMNGTVTSRLLGTASVSSASEALLLVDDPGSGGSQYGNTVAQIPCGFPSQGAGINGCQEWVGNTTTGTGVAVGANPNTGAGGIFNPAPVAYAPNIFQGIVSGGSVTFFGVPVQPPVTSGALRTFRITNVRVNANGITGGGPIPANAVAAIAISGSTSIPVTNSTLTVGYISQSLNAFVTNTFSTSTTNLSTNQIRNQCSSTTSSGGAIAFGTLNYTELQGTAFKPRGSLQNIPGVIYNTESGLVIPGVNGTSSSTGTTNVAGYADWGTRLKAVFNNVPSGVSLWVSVNNLNNTNNGPMPFGSWPGSSFASLIVSETAPDNNINPGGAGSNPSALPLVSQTGTISSGSASPTGTTVGYAPLTIVNGSASAVWEVVNSIPNALENFGFEFLIGYTANVAGNSPPAPATMTVNLSYAPIPTQGAFTISAGGAASSTLGIPRFADTSSGKQALVIAICQTALLYPYVTNTAGFDTGLAVANTTQDPWGTPAQAGSCAVYWYGTAPPATNPGFLGASNGYTTTATTTANFIQAGTISAWQTSVVAPGFNGYVIAVCNFQYAHGFAFISDLGARNLAMGYLADIINGSTTTATGSGQRQSGTTLAPIGVESDGH
ncbi:MAG TPA: hypothetical protein VLW65_06035 [Bryobacteraceae bacterium]|nr:hypothetical protein [Bryobacteraceae bacterium]